MGVAYFFEEAASFQERHLRKQAIQGLGVLFERGKSKAFKTSIITFLSKMKSSGNIEKRVAVAKLLPKAIEVTNDQDDIFRTLLDMIREMTEDNNLEIRQIIGEGLPRVITQCTQSHEKPIRQIITSCLEKGPDFVRALTIPAILQLAVIDRTSASSLLKTSCAISDWRVKYAICTNLNKIGEAFGQQVFGSYITKSYAEQLLNQNPEVRVFAIDYLPTLMKWIDIDAASTHVFPCLTHVVADTEVSVRSAIATKLPLLVTKVGKKKFNEIFLPLILSLLRDEAPEVKSTFLENFTPIFEVVSPQSLMEALEPLLQEMSKSSFWRHKEVILRFFGKVVAAGGKDAIKENHLKIISELIRDPYDSIRGAVANTIVEFIAGAGQDWTFQHIMSEIEKLESNAHFKYRVAYIKFVERLWNQFTEIYSKKMVQSLIPLLGDKVPNVRIGAIKAASNILRQAQAGGSVNISQNLRDGLTSGFQKLSTDSDRGVSIAAKEAIKGASPPLN